MRSLVAGWFSFDEVVATVGDLLARDVLCGWLDRHGIEYEVANAPLVGTGTNWREADPATYDRVIFVCGPFGRRPLLEQFVERFAERPLVGVNLSMLEGAGEWDPFELLFERDGGGDRPARPDLAFAAPPQPALSVTAVLLAHPQAEYGEGLQAVAARAIARLPDLRDTALFYTDTDLLDGDRIRRAAEVTSLVARADVVVTTRLHGLVLALRAGVPAVAIDSIPGGAKVTRQARVLDWPAALHAEDMTDESLGEAFDWCLTDEARAHARVSAARAREEVGQVEQALIAGLAAGNGRAGGPQQPRSGR